MLRSLDLGVLNSATKYPSIPTYHQLDPANGMLLPEPTEFTGQVIATEKVDGTNGRIIMLPSGEYVIGSREELLYASGDLIGNPALGIVQALRPVADDLSAPERGLRVLFLEVYGGKVTGASKQYTGSRQVGHRLFDVAEIPDEALTWSREKLSTWREAGGQPFLLEGEFLEFAFVEGLDWVPRLDTLRADEDLPTGLADTRACLADLLPTTRVALDDDAGGQPEGIVFRSLDRSVIAKARFQDYDRTLRKLNQGKPRR